MAAQKDCPRDAQLISIYPFANPDVDGIRFNFFPKFGINEYSIEHYYKPRTNGIEIINNPLGLFLAVIKVPEFGRIFFCDSCQDSFEKVDEIDISETRNIRRINGICLSTMNFEMSQVRGLELSIGGSHRALVDGIVLSPMVNTNFVTRGLAVGLIGNYADEMRGVQIGLLNYSNDTKGIQIGLWNKNEIRSLPFINWNF